MNIKKWNRFMTDGGHWSFRDDAYILEDDEDCEDDTD
jgi:hypothetical protein